MPQPTRPFARASFAAAAALALAVVLSGCAGLDVFGARGEPERDADTKEITSSGQADVFAIEVGDCLDEASADEVSEVPVVPCSEPHDQEVFSEFLLTETEWPGVEAIEEASITRCDAAYEVFVGVTWDESELDWYPFTPTEDGWETLGDRLVQCVSYDPEGKTTGTLKGAAR